MSRFTDNEDGGSMDEEDPSDLNEHFYTKDAAGNELHCKSCGSDCRHPVVVQARRRERSACVKKLRDLGEEYPEADFFEAADTLEENG